MNIMVMAGTSDARRIIKCLSSVEDVFILATATTRHGTDLALGSGADKVLEGFFDSDELVEIIKENDIELLIDATHPFAVAATQNAIKSADSEGIEYIRFERPSTELPDSELVHKCSSFEEAVKHILQLLKQSEVDQGGEVGTIEIQIEEKSIVGEIQSGENGTVNRSIGEIHSAEDSITENQTADNANNDQYTRSGRVFHLAGVNTLHHLTGKVSPELVVTRVLPTVYSLKKCLELGIPHRNIIAMEGTFSKEFNGILMEEYQINVVLTKESGHSGGTISKIQAAVDLGIPLVIVMRPEINGLRERLVFNEVKSLCDEVLKNL